MWIDSKPHVLLMCSRLYLQYLVCMLQSHYDWCLFLILTALCRGRLVLFEVSTSEELLFLQEMFLVGIDVL